MTERSTAEKNPTLDKSQGWGIINIEETLRQTVRTNELLSYVNAGASIRTVTCPSGGTKDALTVGVLVSVSRSYTVNAKALTRKPSLCRVAEQKTL